MSGFTYSINFQAVQAGSLGQTQAILDKLDNSVNQLNTAVGRLGKNFDNAGRQGERSMGGMRNGVAGLIAQLGLAAYVSKSLTAGFDMDRVNTQLAITSGSAEGGARSLKFLEETSERLGTSFRGSLAGYNELARGLQQRGLGDEVDKVFTSLSEASIVNKLTEGEMQGVMSSFAKMAKEGKVSAGAIQNELGSAIPAAWDVAVRASGMSSERLQSAMEKGQISAQKFLPKFAAELSRTYEGALPDAMNSATANMNRFRNAAQQASVAFGENLVPMATKFMTEYLIPAMKWMKDNAATLGKITAIAVGTAVAFKTLITVGNALKSVVWGARMAWMALNVAFGFSPIGVIITAVLALAAAVVWAWNKFEKFRGFVFGFFAYLKENVKLFYETFITPLKNLGKIIVGIFTLDKNLIAEGIKGNMDVFQNTVMKSGERLGKAFQSGYNDGIENFRQSKATKAGSTGGAASAVEDKFASPALPGQSRTPLDSKVKAGLQGISEGGRQMKNITINVNKLVEQLILKAERVDQGISQVRDAVQREFLQVLNTANQIQ